MSRLITPTILDSFAWMKSCPSKVMREKAYEQLKNNLYRKPWEPSEAVKRGIAYEDQVRKVAEDNYLNTQSVPLFPTALTMGLMMRSARWQVKIKTFMSINGVSYCLYGKVDCMRKDCIEDIKTTEKFGGEEKYLSMNQHIFYLFIVADLARQGVVTNNTCYNIEGKDFRVKRKFNYVVTDFKDIHIVKFESPGYAVLRNKVFGKINEFLEFVNKDKDLKLGYETKFCRNN